VDFEPYPDPDKAKKIKKPEVVGYTGIHYLVGLRPDRTALLEYERLSGLWCEIQLKTIFDHAWSQVDHRLRFKSEEFHAMSKEQKDEVLAVFADAARLLNESKAVFSTLRETYEHFRKET
jgi:ppGpp synthetase/RelA/SpoT-type nucleotidyltranferase